MIYPKWSAESAAVLDAEALGPCAVCKAPVLPSHRPTEVYLGESGSQWGVIHGAFDCMDQPRCEDSVLVSGGAGMTTSARCILPENHADVVGHLAGEPS